MILGLSHIAMACDDIEAATLQLAGFGYSERFDAIELENHISKAPYLSRHQSSHHVRALAKDGAMAIELLNHGDLIGPQTSALVPIFRSDAPFSNWQLRRLDSLPFTPTGLIRLQECLGQDLKAFHDPALSITFLWIATQGNTPGLFACAVPTNAPEYIATLIGHLRFHPDTSGLWSLLTPLPSLQAQLIPVASQDADGWSPEPYLDAPGCACLALMVRRTDQSVLPTDLRENAISFTLKVNGKTSEITMVRPDIGPIIELVDQIA
jgi:hypothetical protein